jgi:hypothetical protein
LDYGCGLSSIVTTAICFVAGLQSEKQRNFVGQS